MFGNLLFDGVCDVIIDAVGANESLADIDFFFFFHIVVVFIFVFDVPFLKKYLCSQFFQEFVCLRKQFVYFCVFGLFEFIKILLHVVFLQQLHSDFFLLDFNIVCFLFLLLINIPRLVHYFFSLFFLLPVELQELFLMNSHHFKHFFVLPFFSLFIITLHLIFEFFNSVSGFTVSLQLFPPVEISV